MTTTSRCLWTVLALSLSACSNGARSSSETAGTGAQDPETANRRVVFSNASPKDLQFISAPPAATFLSAYPCNERSAALDLNSEESFSMALVANGDGSFSNKLDGRFKTLRFGFGNVLAWAGFPQVDGELQTLLFLRESSLGLIGERAIVPAVEQLSSAGQVRLTELASIYEVSAADNRGLALSYVTCEAKDVYGVLSKNTAVTIDGPVNGSTGKLRSDATVDDITYQGGTPITFLDGQAKVLTGTLANDTSLADIWYKAGSVIVLNPDVTIRQGTLRDDAVFHGVIMKQGTTVVGRPDGTFTGTPKSAVTSVYGNTTLIWAGEAQTDFFADGRVERGSFAAPSTITFHGQSCTYTAAKLQISGSLVSGNLASPCTFTCRNNRTQTFQFSVDANDECFY